MKQSPQEVACTLGTHKARWDKAPEQMYNPTRGNGDSNRYFLSHTLKNTVLYLEVLIKSWKEKFY